VSDLIARLKNERAVLDDRIRALEAGQPEPRRPHDWRGYELEGLICANCSALLRGMVDMSQGWPGYCDEWEGPRLSGYLDNLHQAKYELHDIKERIEGLEIRAPMQEWRRRLHYVRTGEWT